jgi:hypothetical protein
MLGRLPNTVVLGECNPSSALLFDQQLNPHVQLKKWYPDLFAEVGGGFAPTDMADPPLFGRFLRLVADLADDRGKRLLVRDYNYVDYIGTPFTNPRHESSLLVALDGVFPERRPVVMVRHPLRQFQSLRSHAGVKDTLTPEVFLTGYERFRRDFTGASFITYEELLLDPERTFRAVCRQYDMPFAVEAIEKFYENAAVTGHLGRLDDRIIAPSSRGAEADAASRLLEAHPMYGALLDRLGYR